MTCELDAYRLRPRHIDAELYIDQNRARAEPQPQPQPQPNLAEISAVGDQRAAGRPYLPCPDCARTGHPGRIGSRRNGCSTCNRFAAAVRNGVRRRALDVLTTAEQERLRAAAEAEVYARFTTSEKR